MRRKRVFAFSSELDKNIWSYTYTYNMDLVGSSRLGDTLKHVYYTFYTRFTQGSNQWFWTPTKHDMLLLEYYNATPEL